MENKKSRLRWQWSLLLGFSAMAVMFFFWLSVSSEKTPVRRVLRVIRGRGRPNFGLSLRTNVRGKEVVMSNGLVRVTLSNPGGDVIGISYGGIDNLLEVQNSENNRGYWDVVWNPPPGVSNIDRLHGTNYEVVKSDENQIEISFKRTWNISLKDTTIPLNVDKRYILLRGYSGFYAYAILERLSGWPASKIGQLRIVYKLGQDKFNYMAVSNDRQRQMPTPSDRATGQLLAYPEAVLLTNSSNPEFRGEVDDKYQYSIENQDNRVHGWICSDPPVGMWMITPSNEFRNAGPIKQDLTSHVGPTMLSMFVSSHYAGRHVGISFQEGEPWKMVYGPVFIHLNSVPRSEDPRKLWDNAKLKMQEEVKKWPYNFPQSQDFPSAAQRGTVTGQLLVKDGYINNSLVSAGFAYVGLAAPGEIGSWQTESKSYQFWTRADKEGYFSINNVCPGNYDLYSWVPGFIGNYKYNEIITIEQGSIIKLNNIVFVAPRMGPTLWEIGIPDRSAAEFYIPDPFPTLMNRLLNNVHQDKFRQYGLWERYSELYPLEDLIYTVGVSNYQNDWFFAQVTRDKGNSTYEPTTWQIIFPLENWIPGNYTLQLALASATDSHLMVWFNDRTGRPQFSTGTIGGDNAIARHGIHGLYWLYTINIPSNILHKGNNTIYLTQTRSTSTFQGVMYDYIRLEAPLHH